MIINNTLLLRKRLLGGLGGIYRGYWNQNQYIVKTGPRCSAEKYDVLISTWACGDYDPSQLVTVPAQLPCCPAATAWSLWGIKCWCPPRRQLLPAVEHELGWDLQPCPFALLSNILLVLGKIMIVLKDLLILRLCFTIYLSHYWNTVGKIYKSGSVKLKLA